MKNVVWNWIYSNSKKSIPVICLLTVFSISLSMISLAFSLVSKDVIDIATRQKEGVLITSCLLLVALILSQLLLQISITFVNVQANSKMEINLKRHLFKILIRKDYLSVQKYHSAELLNRINSDVSVIVSGIITIIPSLALFLTKIIGGFIILSRLDIVFAFIILLVGPVVLLFARIYSKKFKTLHKMCQNADGKTKAFMQEILQNLLVVKSFNNEDNVLKHSEKLQLDNYKLKIKQTITSILANIGVFIVFNVGYYFALAYSAFQLYNGIFTFGTVTAILQLVGQIQTPFKNISQLIPQFYTVIASVERLLELENLLDEGDIKKLDSRAVYNNMVEIVFENVNFSYNSDATVSNIEFCVKKGQCVAIAGESGSGKSTAIKLLLGIMEPQGGRIYIKTSNDEIILDKNTRDLFAYVPQGNLILSGTIRENILFSSKDASEDKIIECAKIAQIWSFISQLENGLDTMIGEKGIGLSEGQVQRIAIARALVYDAPILLLDESTSALDSDTEWDLLKAIKNMTDKTCIIVSHKKAVFDICDKTVYIIKK